LSRDLNHHRNCHARPEFPTSTACHAPQTLRSDRPTPDFAVKGHGELVTRPPATWWWRWRHGGVPGPGIANQRILSMLLGAAVDGSLTVFADVWDVPGARLGLPGTSVLRAGQVGFDPPVVAGQPSAALFGDGSRCRGRLVRAEHQWWAGSPHTVQARSVTEPWGTQAAQCWVSVSSPNPSVPATPRPGRRLAGRLAHGWWVRAAVWAGVTAAHRWGRWPGRGHGAGFRGGSAAAPGADLIVKGLMARRVSAIVTWHTQPVTHHVKGWHHAPPRR